MVEMKTSQLTEAEPLYLWVRPPVRNAEVCTSTTQTFSFQFLDWSLSLPCRINIALQRKICKKSKKAGLKSQQRDILGIISQACQDRTMCYGVHLRKQRNSQRITSELVSHFGKDFLYLLVLSIKIDPAGYNDIINHVQKSSKLEKKI